MKEILRQSELSCVPVNDELIEVVNNFIKNNQEVQNIILPVIDNVDLFYKIINTLVGSIKFFNTNIVRIKFLIKDGNYISLTKPSLYKEISGIALEESEIKEWFNKLQNEVEYNYNKGSVFKKIALYFYHTLKGDVEYQGEEDIKYLHHYILLKSRSKFISKYLEHLELNNGLSDIVSNVCKLVLVKLVKQGDQKGIKELFEQEKWLGLNFDLINLRCEDKSVLKIALDSGQYKILPHLIDKFIEMLKNTENKENNSIESFRKFILEYEECLPLKEKNNINEMLPISYDDFDF